MSDPMFLDKPRNITINGKPIPSDQELAQGFANLRGCGVELRDAYGNVVAAAQPALRPTSRFSRKCSHQPSIWNQPHYSVLPELTPLEDIMQAGTKTTITMSERIATAHVTTEGADPITGDVKFVRDGQPIGSSPVENGQAQHPIYGSTDRLLAVYEGDENNAQSISKFWDPTASAEEPFVAAPLTNAQPIVPLAPSTNTSSPFLTSPIAPAEPAHA